MFDQIMSRAEVLKTFGIGNTTLCKWVRENRIPAPTRLGRKSVWFRESIEAALVAMKKRAEKGMRK